MATSSFAAGAIVLRAKQRDSVELLRVVKTVPDEVGRSRSVEFQNTPNRTVNDRVKSATLHVLPIGRGADLCVDCDRAQPARAAARDRRVKNCKVHETSVERGARARGHSGEI